MRVDVRGYAHSAIAVLSGFAVANVVLLGFLNVIYGAPVNWPDPTGAMGWIVFSLYLMGIIVAIETAGGWIAQSILPVEYQTGFFQDLREQ